MLSNYLSKKWLVAIEFLKGMLLVAILTSAITTIYVFWKCPNNECTVTECTGIIDGPTPEHPALCTSYETRSISFRELLKYKLYDQVTGATFGFGLLVGTIMVVRKKQHLLDNQ